MYPLIILCLFFSHDSLADTPSIPDTEQWRKAKNDAVNCAYMLLNFQDIPVDYQMLQTRFRSLPSGAVNLVDIREILQEYNVTSQIVLSKPDSLEHLPLPVLVHVQDEGEKSGRFIILLGKNGPDYHIVEGGTVCYTEVPEDEFRRSWNGAVLVLLPERHSQIVVLFLGALLGFLCVYLGRHAQISYYLRRHTQ